MPALGVQASIDGIADDRHAVATIPEDAPAQLFRDEGEARRNPFEPGDHRRLGRGVHRGRLVAALAVAHARARAPGGSAARRAPR